ncbi:LD-carboxypeptidase LdcB, LAS superfamily [Colwellia chukchiensis]|uniref:LD-carboxypeptidase LdcB, LAS superfamily n=1 Tax=Colwellia chukchiensis TaxID=641665 RepID=A0A1H7NS70_9GAMM|nr:M15 family metallopeptidase [Colwellia chukchiensis]SEL25837.1 LD-carboxypeptidase LdcB, LAS superfamily [Colwellia chukchiensis]
MRELELILTGKTDHHIHWLSERIGIHHEMSEAFAQLKLAAKSAGFELAIASGFRSFDRQLAIWQNKFIGRTAIKDAANRVLATGQLNDVDKIHAIMLFSALPGASRHHWGCDIDIYAENLLPQGKSLALEPWEYQNTGYFYPLSTWLKKHASDFGFYFPYDRFRGGVAEEPWHLSYLPLAQGYQANYNEALLAKTLINSDIHGKAVLLTMLPELYHRYIVNVAAAN